MKASWTLVDAAPSHQETPKPPALVFYK